MSAPRDYKAIYAARKAAGDPNIVNRKPARRTGVALLLRVTPEMREHLQNAADEYGVSMSWIARKALAEFLPRLIPAEEFSLTRRPEGTS